MSDEKRISIFLRTTISEGGLHYKPGPIIEAQQNSSKTINVVLRDLPLGKQPVNLPYLGVIVIRFLIRKHRYPCSAEDIVVDLPEKQIGISNKADLTIDLTNNDLAIPVTDYWYDIVVEKRDNLTMEESEIIRSPLGRFRVHK